ncbi:TetR/AcrR family transcriptional regulator [Nocardiopsis sp. MG754419]|uniref:TetR/AcrR family transcriptional regulator n=1 Tax=Nocardiopsis sp. MG754419 TaxID=2259865 RepID=UPI001BA4FF3B|nr:TetR family transcriptional regulator C-terminal domain-containing protein [Nocardiopsis sp. MG754419]MBR8740285.1 TetR family transcriptional regulator [Nocardiopsis sp. MG754419]
MSQTRARALDAAIDLVGTRGLHALTHGKVDTAAGLPRGSTSNHFRTRAALVRGVVERLEELDHRDWAGLEGSEATSLDGLVDTVALFVSETTTTHRVRTVARYTLTMEAAHSLEVRASLNRGHDLIRGWVTEILTDLGAADPHAAARTLLAYADGLIMHALVRPEVVEPRGQLLRVARACLTP